MTDNIFGLSAKALELSEQRAVLLTNNLVNSSTPHYKARDFDFNKAMHEASDTYSALAITSSNHLPALNQIGGQELKYRIPMQPSLDGNTVDDDIERKNFIQNSVNYEVNLTFIQNKTMELMKALKGA